VDIPGRGMVLSTLVTSTVLTVGSEQVDVVASDKVLGKIDDGLGQTGFTMVVGCMLRYITNKLGDLCRTLAELLLETKVGLALISFLSLRLKQAQITFL